MIYIPYTILRRKLTPRSVSKSLVTGSRCLLLFPQFPSKVLSLSKPPQAIRSKSCKLRIGWFMWRQWKCGFKWFNVSCNCWCFVDGSGAICCWLMRCLYGPVAWQSSESSWIASGVFWSKLICIVMLWIVVALTARYRCNFPVVFFRNLRSFSIFEMLSNCAISGSGWLWTIYGLIDNDKAQYITLWLLWMWTFGQIWRNNWHEWLD